MTKLILVLVTILSASASFAECPFKNMNTNSQVGMFDTASNAYFQDSQVHSQQVQMQMPSRRQK